MIEKRLAKLRRNPRRRRRERRAQRELLQLLGTLNPKSARWRTHDEQAQSIAGSRRFPRTNTRTSKIRNHFTIPSGFALIGGCLKIESQARPNRHESAQSLSNLEFNRRGELCEHQTFNGDSGRRGTPPSRIRFRECSTSQLKFNPSRGSRFAIAAMISSGLLVDFLEPRPGTVFCLGPQFSKRIGSPYFTAT